MKIIMASHFQELQESGSRYNMVKGIFFLDQQGYLSVTEGLSECKCPGGMFCGGRQVIASKKCTRGAQRPHEYNFVD